MTDAEKTILTDIRDHEIIHRWISSKQHWVAGHQRIIPALEVNFSSIDFTKRDAVLGAAKLFEDTGVAAYNGAGNLIKNEAYLLLAGKIVSVEARHASVIRDLLNPKTADLLETISLMQMDLIRLLTGRHPRCCKRLCEPNDHWSQCR